MKDTTWPIGLTLEICARPRRPRPPPPSPSRPTSFVSARRRCFLGIAEDRAFKEGRSASRESLRSAQTNRGVFVEDVEDQPTCSVARIKSVSRNHRQKRHGRSDIVLACSPNSIPPRSKKLDPAYLAVGRQHPSGDRGLDPDVREGIASRFFFCRHGRGWTRSRVFCGKSDVRRSATSAGRSSCRRRS